MKSSKKVFVLTEAVLGVMLILTVIGMLWGKSSENQGKISVVIRGSDDSRWAAFKYGLQMAAKDEEMELFIVSTGEDLTVEKEEEIIEGEIVNGADAVIVQPVPGEHARKMLKKMEKKTTVILVEDTAAGDTKEAGIPVVKPDDSAMGGRLAEELIRDYNGRLQGKTMGIVSEYGDSEAIRERKEGMISGLEDMGVNIVWEIPDLSIEEEMVPERKSKVDFVIALDDYSLVHAGKAAASNDLHGALVYGIGNSMEAVYCLDTDYIQCLVVPDDFNMGYHSVAETTESLGRMLQKPKSRTVGYTVMRKQNLFSRENQEILFTMSQ